MKKTLLCFLLLFTYTFYAQAPDMARCEGESFDLTTQIPFLIGNLNPNETSVTFHHTLSYAENGLYPISSPSTYTVSMMDKVTIYARINNQGVITTSFFNVIVHPGMYTAHSDEQPYNCYNNGSAKIEVLSGGTPPFLYSIDNGPFTSNNNFTALYPGKYLLTVKDALGCTQSSTHVLYSTNPIGIKANVVNNICFGAKEGSIELIASGGSGPYRYSLKNIKNNIELAKTQSQNVFTNLPAGVYVSTVTDDIQCASKEYKIEIFEPDELSLYVHTTEATCKNDTGSITIDASDSRANGYSIDNGVTFSSSNTFTNLPVGTYSIVAKYSSGCLSAVYKAEIVRASLPIVNAKVKDITCEGAVPNGSINLSAVGGQEPYLYSINGGAYKSATQYNKLAAGNYAIVLKDGNGCLSTIDVVIKQNYLRAIATVVGQTVTVTTTGGSDELYYGISPNLEKYSTNNIFTDVVPGNQTLIVSDLLGCSVILNIFVNSPAPLINGKNTMAIEFTPGQTLADIAVEGQNIKWYSTSGSTTKKSNKIAETTLPATTLLVDGVTYYASQTINEIESTERLAITAKTKGSLSTPDFESANFKFYPNPVKHNLSINHKSMIENIEIFSLSGKSVLFKKINSTTAEIDLSTLSSGMYILNVKSDVEEKAIKFIKE